MLNRLNAEFVTQNGAKTAYISNLEISMVLVKPLKLSTNSCIERCNSIKTKM